MVSQIARVSYGFFYVETPIITRPWLGMVTLPSIGIEILEMVLLQLSWTGAPSYDSKSSDHFGIESYILWWFHIKNKPSHGGFHGHGGTPKWIVYKGKSHWNGWFRGTPISGNLQIYRASFDYSSNIAGRVTRVAGLPLEVFRTNSWSSHDSLSIHPGGSGKSANLWQFYPRNLEFATFMDHTNWWFHLALWTGMYFEKRNSMENSSQWRHLKRSRDFLRSAKGRELAWSGYWRSWLQGSSLQEMDQTLGFLQWILDDESTKNDWRAASASGYIPFFKCFTCSCNNGSTSLIWNV